MFLLNNFRCIVTQPKHDNYIMELSTKPSQIPIRYHVRRDYIAKPDLTFFRIIIRYKEGFTEHLDNNWIIMYTGLYRR